MFEDFSFSPDEGATPIDPDAAGYLREEFKWITTRGELNSAEGDNVSDGMIWLVEHRIESAEELASIWFQKELHYQMFGNVWQWAGALRDREMSIGVAPEQIQIELHILKGDLLYWNESGMEPVEVCARFHHRQVQIHPFVNGNGRHSRILTERLAEMLQLKARNGTQILTWGSNASNDDAGRQEYLSALRQADRGDYEYLIAIAQN